MFNFLFLQTRAEISGNASVRCALSGSQLPTPCLKSYQREIGSHHNDLKPPNQFQDNTSTPCKEDCCGSFGNSGITRKLPHALTHSSIHFGYQCNGDGVPATERAIDFLSDNNRISILPCNSSLMSYKSSDNLTSITYTGDAILAQQFDSYEITNHMSRISENIHNTEEMSSLPPDKRSHINRTESLDNEPSMYTSKLGGKGLIHGSALKRDQSFPYATICRGSPAHKIYYDCSHDHLPNILPRLQRGSSSHELVRNESNQPLNGAVNQDSVLVLKNPTNNYPADHNLRSLHSDTSADQQLKSMASAQLHQSNSNIITKELDYKSSNPRTIQPEQSSLQCSPIQSVIDLPKVTSGSHQYYTLKISSTRHNNESFV